MRNFDRHHFILFLRKEGFVREGKEQSDLEMSAALYLPGVKPRDSRIIRCVLGAAKRKRNGDPISQRAEPSDDAAVAYDNGRRAVDKLWLFS